MTDHLRRIRAYMEHETQALLVAAERARLLDHRGNRGSEVEHTIRSWIHERVGPNYAVSSGEIIDSYDTDATFDSRQQDGIVHTNDLEGRRFLLPSGLRLVPIETVAAVVEVKLTLTKQGVLEADAAAQQTARLKLSVREQPVGSPGFGGGHSNSAHAREFNQERAEQGVPLSDPIFQHRASFTIIGIDGPQNVETLADWLKETTSLNMIACLGAGCARRWVPREGPRGFAWWFKGTRPFSRSHRASEQPSATTSRVPRGFRRPAGDTIRCRRSTTGMTLVTSFPRTTRPAPSRSNCGRGCSLIEHGAGSADGPAQLVPDQPPRLPPPRPPR